MPRRAGFTLIELLVVVAIIAILASIVLAFINSARDKGNNTKIKSELLSARSIAEVYFDRVGSYNGSSGNVSGNCAQANSMFTDVASKMSMLTDVANYPIGTTLTCYSTNTSYAISASLKVPDLGNTHWCVDSSGDSLGRTSAITGTAC